VLRYSSIRPTMSLVKNWAVGACGFEAQTLDPTHLG